MLCLGKRALDFDLTPPPTPHRTAKARRRNKNEKKNRAQDVKCGLFNIV